MRGAQWGLRRKPTSARFCCLLTYLCGGDGGGRWGGGGCVGGSVCAPLMTVR